MLMDNRLCARVMSKFIENVAKMLMFDFKSQTAAYGTLELSSYEHEIDEIAPGTC